MGTDIHFYVEKRDALGQWQSVDVWEENPYYDPDEDDSGGKMHRPWKEAFYTGRNYELFAILANVRNGAGFAGIKINGGLNPIAMPRGLPEDVTELVREDVNWGHSHSWYTLKELLDYDWTQTTMKCGYVNMPTFYDWNRWARKENENPNEYAGGVGGNIVDETTMQRMIDERLAGHENIRYDKTMELLQQDDGWKTYVFVEWEQTYYQTTRRFWSDTMPRLLHLAQGEYKNVRVIFGFDS